MQQGKIIYQLEKLWLKILECLSMSQLISDGPLSQRQQLLQVALSHPHHAISIATASACRAEANIKISMHSGCLGSKLVGLWIERRKDHNSSSSFDKAIAREEIGISSRLALAMSKKITKHSDSDAGSLKISAGLGRKRLKIMKYSTKPKEINKNTVRTGDLNSRMDSVFSPCCMENKECRRPELILEMLKRKR
jgi:telomere-associated protein RIF1